MTEDDLIRAMDAFVGTGENPAHSNCNRVTQQFGPVGGATCFAWCAATISDACADVGFPLHEAAVGNIERRAKAGWNGMYWSDSPVRASAAIYDFSGIGDWNHFHTGLVYEVLAPAYGFVGVPFRDIEGNYADRCDRWLRDEKHTRGFACFPFDAAPAPEPPTPAPRKDSTMIDIVQVDGQAAWWSTDWQNSKSWIPSKEAAAGLVVQIVSGGGIIGHSPENGPRVLKPERANPPGPNDQLIARLYALPIVGQAPPR